MRVNDVVVQVRDKDLNRVGTIRGKHLRFKATIRHNDVGEWELVLPKDHPMVGHLAQRGSGILVAVRGASGFEPAMSGPTFKPQRVTNKENPDGTFTFTGHTDDILLRFARCWPQPSNADPTTQNVSNYDVAGVAETVMRQLVNVNIGPSAPAGRKGRLTGQLVLATNGFRGPNVTKSPRFQILADVLREIAVYSNLGFRVIQVGDQLEFQVLTLTDRSPFVALDMRNGTITSESVEVSPPTVTRQLVAGQGEGTDRTFVYRTNTAAADAEDDWGFIIEGFRDARGTALTAELEQAGDEDLLAGGFTSTAVKVIPSDDQTMRFMTDYFVGDTVAVIVSGQRTTSDVTAAAIIANADKTAVGIALGDISDFNPETALVAKADDTARRVEALEREAEKGEALTWSTLPGKPALFPPDLPGRLAPSVAAASTVTNANLAIEAGWYYAASSATNIPTATNWIIEVTNTNSSTWVWQTATEANGAATTGMTYRRRRDNLGAWSAWSRIRLTQDEVDARYYIAAAATTSAVGLMERATQSEVNNATPGNIAVTADLMNAVIAEYSYSVSVANTSATNAGTLSAVAANTSASAAAAISVSAGGIVNMLLKGLYLFTVTYVFPAGASATGRTFLDLVDVTSGLNHRMDFVSGVGETHVVMSTLLVADAASRQARLDLYQTSGATRLMAGRVKVVYLGALV